MFDIGFGEGGVIRLSGRFDAAVVEQAIAFLDKVESSATVDCRQLDYIASAGLGALFATQRRLLDKQESLTLANLSPHIYEIFDMCGFETVFEVVEAPPADSDSPGT
jgi:anti-sigma B factor antagonist